MKRHKLFFAVISASIFVMTGCKKDEAPTNTPTPTPTAAQAPTPTNFPGATPVNVIAVIRTSTTLEPVPGFPVTTDVNVGVANFGTPGTDKGTVTAAYGGTNYAFGKTNSNGAISYIHPNPTSPATLMDLGGGGSSTVSFTVSGYAITPAGSNTIVVPGQLKMTAPAANASVTRTVALPVSWTVAGAGAQNAIFITDFSGHTVFKQNLGAVTSASFTAAEMGGLSAGGAFVYAISYNYRLTNGNETVIIGEATTINQITLQ
jgi:hypothetical protein